MTKKIFRTIKKQKKRQRGWRGEEERSKREV